MYMYEPYFEISSCIPFFMSNVNEIDVRCIHLEDKDIQNVDLSGGRVSGAIKLYFQPYIWPYTCTHLVNI